MALLLEKQCVHSRRQSFEPIFMKLCTNVYLNKILAGIKNRSCWVKKQRSLGQISVKKKKKKSKLQRAQFQSNLHETLSEGLPL